MKNYIIKPGQLYSDGYDSYRITKIEPNRQSWGIHIATGIEAKFGCVDRWGAMQLTHYKLIEDPTGTYCIKDCCRAR
jgi:hypothetical protein